MKTQKSLAIALTLILTTIVTPIQAKSQGINNSNVRDGREQLQDATTTQGCRPVPGMGKWCPPY